MIKDIRGLHHVTSMARDASRNNRFFTQTLGLRRIKKTVNFDAPDVYHLYYGDAVGTPGSVMTYFPFPDMPQGRRGTGEVGITEYAVPQGALRFWDDWLSAQNVRGLTHGTRFGETRLGFEGPDGEGFALVERAADPRAAWQASGVPDSAGIQGFCGASLRLGATGATGELLEFMGYRKAEQDGATTRYRIEGGNGADIIDIEEIPGGAPAGQGAGSVHHIAFAVEDRAAQLRVRAALMDTGYQVTPVIDRSYFYAIYFRAPGGVLFEISTNEPGFDLDEDTKHLGEALKLPPQYEAQRSRIEAALPALDA